MKLLGMILILLTGCRFTDKTGTTHHVIVGFGIVSVPSTNSFAAHVSKTQVLGLGICDTPDVRFNLGYAAATVIRVPTNQNLLIEVSDLPGRPLKVTVQP